jgi:HEAT repeat protein
MTSTNHFEEWQNFYNSSNPEVQRRALRQIVKFTDSRFTTILLDALGKYCNQGFGADIVKALVRNNDSLAVEPLIAYLQNPDRWIRQMACEALGKLKDKRATVPLVICLDDPDQLMRWQAALALGSIKDPRALPAFLRRYTQYPEDDINVTFALESALRQFDALPIIINGKSYDANTGNFSVILTSAGKQVIQVIAALREILAPLGLIEAKRLTENTPVIICNNVNAKKAQEIETVLKVRGATVKLKDNAE